MIIDLISFGFKYNNTPDTNYLIDVRFLNNPYYIKELKELTGLDKEVIEFFEKDKDTQKFINELYCFIELLISENIKAKKQKITIAIGCTGGQHRSPYITEYIAKELHQRKQLISELTIYHKQLKKYNMSMN